ncbi:hypothetical protein F5878DRAFT_380792 [Lentinula raphanica]|uniref:Uncharacterized protein n=1 Tax=Lentinula raphanica TaxID=153919 RepID=A0AA38P0K2_9AGAR|nr:hypothetical protein F5878DRAFT_380792 [Lentinula raphanica]
MTRCHSTCQRTVQTEGLKRSSVPKLSIPSTPSLSSCNPSSPPSSPALTFRLPPAKTSLGSASLDGKLERINREHGYNGYIEAHRAPSHANADGNRPTADVPSIWNIFRTQIIPPKPKIPEYISTGGFVRDPFTVCPIRYSVLVLTAANIQTCYFQDENNKCEYYTHGARRDACRNLSMQSKPSVTSSSQRTSSKPEPSSKGKEHAMIFNSEDSHRVSFEVMRANDSRDPFVKRERTVRRGDIVTNNQPSPSVDRETRSTQKSSSRRFLRAFHPLAKLFVRKEQR